MTDFLVESVLENLNSLIQKEFRPFLTFEQDLKKLASTLTKIMGMLEDAEEKKFVDRTIGLWLGKLNIAAQILDEIIEECNNKALGLEYEEVKGGASCKVQCSFLYSFHPRHIVFSYKIAKNLERISERLMKIAKEGTRFHLTERRNKVARYSYTTFVTEPRVYGREEEKNEVLYYLTGYPDGSENGLSVYPMVGPEGLGKTTFVKLIFNHESVVNHFDLRIWPFVSEDSSFKGMIRAIVKAATGCECEDLDIEILQKHLQYLIQSKRYLLVLDEIRDLTEENWQRLKSVLVNGEKGCSILVTTSKSDVAVIMKAKHLHELPVLSENDSWELFIHEAFGHKVKQVEFEDIGREIIKKCGGFPLAIKALGGLLRFKSDEKGWLYVKENILWSAYPRDYVTVTLILNYLNLPLELRRCFAYCVIFPYGGIIRKENLIELWMANGFISPNYDAGDRIWNELYLRSFFEATEIDEIGNVTSFKMHSSIFLRAYIVVGDYVKVIKDGERVTTLSNRIRHLSDYRWRIESGPDMLQQVRCLRTYLFPNHCNHQLSPDVLKCHSLRVLHLRLRGELPSSIGDLKQLRYLNLSKSDFKTLPEILSKLWNLQIMILDYCKHLQKFPNSLIDLKYLQKLSFKDCHNLSSLPPHIGRLTSLKSLTSYFVGNENGFFLAELRALILKGDLAIKNLEKVKSLNDAKEANMSNKRLNQLRLSWNRNEETKLGENVEEILEVLEPDTQKLVSLTITGFKGVHFPRWMFSSSLKKLQIERCRELKGLHEASRVMTSLHSLRLYDLPNLEDLPDCFEYLSSLRHLAIGFCSKLRHFPKSLTLISLKKLEIYACPELEKLCETLMSTIIVQVAEIRVNGALIRVYLGTQSLNIGKMLCITNRVRKKKHKVKANNWVMKKMQIIVDKWKSNSNSNRNSSQLLITPI